MKSYIKHDSDSPEMLEKIRVEGMGIVILIIGWPFVDDHLSRNYLFRDEIRHNERDYHGQKKEETDSHIEETGRRPWNAIPHLEKIL